MPVCTAAVKQPGLNLAADEDMTGLEACEIMPLLHGRYASCGPGQFQTGRGLLSRNSFMMCSQQMFVPFGPELQVANSRLDPAANAMAAEGADSSCDMMPAAERPRLWV
jgi:hypothetical protein